MRLRRAIVIGITGAPSSGKSRLAKIVASKLPGSRTIEIGEIVKRAGFHTSYDRRDRAYVADMRKLKAFLLEESKKGGTLVIVGHMLPDTGVRTDLTIVVRARLEDLYDRMVRRGYPRGKIRENISAEMSDYCGETAKNEGMRTFEVYSKTDEKRLIAAIWKMQASKGNIVKLPKLKTKSRAKEFERFVMAHPGLGI